ncbi:MAG: VWA domain-containing protein, partial [Candidatus Zixiibacteriota bacterium]
VVFAIDISSSMAGAKIANAKQALIQNSRDLLAVGSEDCKVGIVSFASRAKIVCRPTSDLTTLERAVATMTPSGTTAMDEGIRQAAELVMTAPTGTDRDVVMLTDGMPDPQRRQSTLAATQTAQSKGITLSTVGIGSEDVDLDFLNKLTPISLVIDRVEETSVTMATLLKLSAAARRGGLTDIQKGGLHDAEDL